MTEQVLITPEIAKRDVPEVREVSASLNVPAINTGDEESVDLYKSRETKRGEGDKLPENRHSQMRNTLLASSDDAPLSSTKLASCDMDSWFHHPAMSESKLSSSECSELSRLYE